MASLHVDPFSEELKDTLQQWGANQVPNDSLSRVVITACRKFADEQIAVSPAEKARQAKIEQLLQELEALKRGAAGFS
jgi:hypothetical protein